MKFGQISSLFEAIGGRNLADVDVIVRSIIEAEMQDDVETGRLLQSAYVKNKGTSVDAQKDDGGTKDFDPTEIMSFTAPDVAQSYMIVQPQLESKFKRVETEFKRRKDLAKKGLNHTRKILLYGPPGCGKTLGANRIAHNLGIPLAKVKLDAIVSTSQLGATLVNLRKLFEYAKDNLCVLLIDECDFIARARTNSSENADMARVVNVLLVLLDEYVSDSIIIATTNLESAVDRALFRRFEMVLEVPLPLKSEIVRILKETIEAKIYLDRAVDVNNYMDRLKGFSGAYVVRVANDAVKQAIMSNSKFVTDAHIQTAIAEVYKI